MPSPVESLHKSIPVETHEGSFGHPPAFGDSTLDVHGKGYSRSDERDPIWDHAGRFYGPFCVCMGYDILYAG